MEKCLLIYYLEATFFMTLLLGEETCSKGLFVRRTDEDTAS